MNYRLKFLNQGFSLIEVLMIIGTVGFLVILVNSLPNALNLNGKSHRISLAKEVAVKKIDDLRNLTYANLSLGENPIVDNRLNQLSQSSGLALIEDCDLTTCPNGENVKMVTVTISWKELGKDQILKMETLISQGGLNQ